LLLGWVALWSLVFAGLAFCVRPMRRASTYIANAVDVWMQRSAQAREESRLWDYARQDARVMDELRAAEARGC
jgi:hypothetical protein